MALSDGLNVLFSIISNIVNIFSIPLFGIPISVYLVGAFVCRMVMNGVFDVTSSDSKPKNNKGE